MATVRLRNLHKSFGDVEVIKGMNLDVEEREFAVIVGPSGCGKSTLLRLVAGLEGVTSGEILIDGARVNDLPPSKRGLAMVFQNYALYPHMSVADNMGFSLRLAGVSREEQKRKVLAAARILQIEELLRRKPKELSGGQRQRVAIGRAIVRNPRVFLFDEPLSNLDASLRVQMRIELMRLHEELRATMIYVTHDQVEAMTMADKIVVMQEGRIEQSGSPLDLYRHPANLFIAGFIGSPGMNFIPATIGGVGERGAKLLLPGGAVLELPAASGALAEGNKVTVGIRPEHLAPGEDGPFRGELVVLERLGSATYLHIRIAGGHMLTVQTEGDHPGRVREIVSLAVSKEACHLFDEAGMAIPRTH